MLKKLLIALFVILISGFGAYFYYLTESRIVITPYPYAITEQKVDNLADAEKAEILIIGDRMGKALDKELDSLKSTTKLSIYNWSAPHEGLHRSLYKLKSLKKFPTVVIYHGASEELFEKKFNLDDLANIEKNFTTFQDDKIVSLIITFPILSKYFYKKVHYQDLSSIKENKDLYSPEEKLQQKELSFLIYNQELKDLIEWARAKSVKLIFITTPINNTIAPKETCAHASTPSIIARHEEIEQLLKDGQNKEALSMARELAEVTKVNAQSFFLLAQAAKASGDHKLARIAFQRASVFDCTNWRGNAVYNSIILKEASKKQIPVIDFDLEINSNETPEATFFDEIYPQNIFYQGLAKEIDETVKILTKAIK